MMKPKEKNPFIFKNEWKDLQNRSGNNSNLWDGARILLVDVPINKTLTKKILPFYMSPSKEPKATLFIANYVKNCFTVPYHEAAILIHVRTPFGKGVHCPWMIVDDDSAMIYGRDQLGYPKKMGRFIFEEDGSNVIAAVRRRGIDVLKMDAVNRNAEENPGPVFAQKFFNVRNPGLFYLLHTIILFKANEKITESYHADIQLTINESAVDPIARLIDGPPENGRMVVMDIMKGSYLFPVGFAGFQWFVLNHRFRFQ